MNQPKIIVIINKKPYILYASDVDSIRSIPSAERQQLITLLESIKKQESLSQSANQSVDLTEATIADASIMFDDSEIKSEHMASGDVDAVMAQLIMEENLNRKSGLTKQSINKWVIVIAAIIFLLVLIL